MKVTRRTRTKDLLFFINEENFENFLELVPSVPFAKKNLIEFTIKEFSEIIIDEKKYCEKLLLSSRKALVSFGKLKDFRQQMKAITKHIEKFNIRQNADEFAAANGIPFPSSSQRMLLTVCKFFCCKSFEDAEQHTIAEYLLILQDTSTDIMYQKNYSRIINNKQKR